MRVGVGMGLAGSWFCLTQTRRVTLSRGGLFLSTPSPSAQWDLGVRGFSQKSPSPAPLGRTQCCPVFGDFKAFEPPKPSASMPACTPPASVSLGQFPQRPGTQL